MKRRRKTRENAQNEDTKRENERENEEIEGEDRLSDCPDSILVHILSFLNAKDAVQTCILSTRWKHLWKHLPTLSFISNRFKTLKAFTRFVTRILSLRDSSSELNTLTFQRGGIVEPNLITRMVRYALSHNVQRLGLCCQFKDIQPSLFSSHTLKNLTLDMCSCRGGRELSNVVVFPNNLNLPALTTLNLLSLAFRPNENGRADPFSGFNLLNSLHIYDCMVLDGKTLCISNTMLIDLSLYFPSEVDGDFLNPKIDLYAPKLCTFSFLGTPFQNLYGSNLSSLEHLYIDSKSGDGNHLILLNWLIELAHIKSLTVSLSTLKVLFSGPHKLKVKLPSLCNLKMLKVKPDYWVDWGNCFKMVNLLRQNAPFAEFCIEKQFED